MFLKLVYSHYIVPIRVFMYEYLCVNTFICDTEIMKCIIRHVHRCVYYFMNIIFCFLEKTQRTHALQIDTLTIHTCTQTHTHTHTRAWTGYQNSGVRPVCCGPRSWGKLPAAQHVTTNDAARRLLPAAPARACTSQRT